MAGRNGWPPSENDPATPMLTPTLHATLPGLGLTENVAIKILWTILGSGYPVGFLYFDTNTEINTQSEYLEKAFFLMGGPK